MAVFSDCQMLSVGLKRDESGCHGGHSTESVPVQTNYILCCSRLVLAHVCMCKCANEQESVRREKFTDYNQVDDMNSIFFYIL